MHTEEKKVKYPENLPLKELQTASGRSVRWLSKQIGVSSLIISKTINGHYKGINIVPRLHELLNQ